MDPLFIALLVILALIGAPLFAIFGAAAMLLFGDSGTITSVAVDVFSERFADSPTLVTLPLFTFAGYLMAESGTPGRLVRVSRAFFGWLPGGLAMVCLVASAFFTTFTGGSGITIVAIGGLLFPALIQEKYPEKFSLGLVTTGGSLGLLFPPSIPIVLYGVVAGILIDKLFLAGLIPGIITVLLLMGYSFVVGWRTRPTGESLGKAIIRLIGFLTVGWFLIIFYKLFTDKEARGALWEAKWEVALPVVLVAGLATGVLRIHEAAAFTALYVLVVEVFIYRDITIRGDLPRVIKDSMTMLGAILAILATALGFTGYLIQARVPERMVEWMEVFIHSPIAFLFALNLFLLVVGMLMDIFSAIVVVVPLIVPIARHFGIDPYHLGIVFLLNLEIGYLTPPVGLNLFIASFRFEKPVTKLYTAVLPFIGFLILALGITTYVPFLSTFLPNLLETTEISADEIDNMGDEGDTGDQGGGDTLDDMGGDTLDDLGGDTLDDLDDLGGETLDDLGGETLDDMGGDTLDDLEAPDEPTDTPPREGETLDDL
jgi:tripartite ATP-independent transporter DctM subunit